MAKILMIAESGFGKSTSIMPNEQLGIKGLNPKEVFFINVSSKDLPLRGWKKKYTPIEGKNVESGNYLATAEALAIAGAIGALAKKDSPPIVVIDDHQYSMSDYYMEKAKTPGFDKFQDIGYQQGKLFKAIREYPGHVIMMTHPETVQNDYGTSFKAKTIGKMVDQYITIEGKFEIVLYGHQEFDSKNKKAIKQFVTNFDGKYPAKSPAGMFDKLHINNDMGLVLDLVNAYYEGE